MKCQFCGKPATFHITELTEPNGPKILHLCEDHTREYLAEGKSVGSVSSNLTNMLAKQLNLEQAAETISSVDQKTCPICGISFAEFRQVGRFGCAYDYICFQEELDRLLTNIHGETVHVGKRPQRNTGSPDRQHQIIQLRREMKSAVEQEDYESASRIRDQIRDLEAGDNIETSDS